MTTRNLSVFFPCINEEGNIENNVKKAEEVLKRLNFQYEIIIIDDGSTDRTGAIADRLVKENPKIRVIHHPKNLGYGEALKSGFYNALYETIVYTDGDGQFDFSEVTKFLEKIKDHDLVIGHRIKRQDSFLRRLFGWGWKITLLTIFRLTLKDVDCGFKIISKKVLEKIPYLESSRGAMINAELAIKTKKAGFKITEVGVTHYPRLIGKPTGANLMVILKSYLDLLRLWWKLKDQKLLFVLLLGILGLAAFLRFYRLPDYMTFLGDEGRDALVIKKMIFEGHFPLIGPPTSVGNIYLGPLYYYMMLIPMAIFKLNPVAAAGMNAFLGVITVYFIYYLGKLWFNRQGGLIASYLYAISPVTIIYSRSSWNPNPAPLFALIGIYSLYKIHKTGNFLWFILTGLSLGAALQMHYLASILIPVVFVIWFYEIIRRKREKLKTYKLFLGTLLGKISFLVVMSPLVWFDLRHNYLNYRAVTELFNSGGAVKSEIFINIAKLPSLFSYNLIGRHITAENFYLTIVVSLLIIAGILHKFKSFPKFMLFTWLLIGLLGLSFYQQNIYDHYLGFLNPVPFLLLGAVVVIRPKLKVARFLISVLVIVMLILLTFANLKKNPLLLPPNKQLERTQNVAKFVISKSENKDFNFALIAKSNYDSAYQFYLDLYGYKSKEVPFDVTDQLFVVCEDEICDPTHSPKYEVAAFGWSRIAWEESVYGVKIYKLIHNPSGKP